MKVGALFLICWTAAAQGTSPPVAGEDSDPTRPVIWSLREEYYNLPGQAWNNAFIFRIDRAVLKKRRWPVKNNGIVTRLDIPFLASHRAGGTNAGLGDIYAEGGLVNSATCLTEPTVSVPVNPLCRTWSK